MAAFNKFNQFVADLANKVHNLGSDSLKIYLSNTAPSASNAVKGDIAEISTGNGYTGGVALTVTASSQSSGTYKLVANDLNPMVTASGSVGPFRYAILYNDTPTSPADPLIGWWDYGSSITMASGETFTVDLDGSNGVLQLQ
jgi:hypothetical protein